MKRLWWHVYGGEVADMSVDDDGNLSPAWNTAIFGQSSMDPDDVPRTAKGWDGAVLDYLGSFDRDPTDAEIDALTPAPYRDESGTRGQR